MYGMGNQEPLDPVDDAVRVNNFLSLSVSLVSLALYSGFAWGGEKRSRGKETSKVEEDLTMMGCVW
jgi:hypothetical protein